MGTFLLVPVMEVSEGTEARRDPLQDSGRPAHEEMACALLSLPQVSLHVHRGLQKQKPLVITISAEDSISVNKHMIVLQF